MCSNKIRRIIVNDLLSSVYSAVLPSAPYVIAAYVLVWLALCVFVVVISRGIRENERDLERLEAQVEKMREKMPE